MVVLASSHAWQSTLRPPELIVQPARTTMNLASIRTTFTPHGLSALRIVTGLLFLRHGTAKDLKYPPMAQFDKLQTFSPSGIACIFELVGGALIVIGLFTRPVAFVLSGLMAFAYFMAHA